MEEQKVNFRGNKKYGVVIVIAIIVALVLINAVVVVPAGHTGVLTTLGKVNEGVYQEGVHLVAPFVQDIIIIDNRIVKLQVETEAFSKDLQTVETTLAINYRVDTQKSNSIYKNIGADYENVLVVPAVNEVLKAVSAKYTAEESVTNRSIISDGLLEELNSKLNVSGLYVTDVNIINYDFSEAFINAIEEKQVAQQKLLKAETDKQTAITNAQAEAETIRIKAEAEAAANDVISGSLTQEIIEYMKLEKWDGKLPKVTGSSGALINFDLEEIEE